MTIKHEHREQTKQYIILKKVHKGGGAEVDQGKDREQGRAGRGGN